MLLQLFYLKLQLLDGFVITGVSIPSLHAPLLVQVRFCQRGELGHLRSNFASKLIILTLDEFSIHRLWIDNILKLKLPEYGEHFPTEHLPDIVILVLEISNFIKIRIFIIIIRVEVCIAVSYLILMKIYG